MKFRLYREYGALNSTPVFQAFEEGLKGLGLISTNSNDGIPVIWSVLWRGRMLPNQAIYQSAVQNKRPILIIEIGSLRRGITWKIGLNHINRNGTFPNLRDLDFDRPKKISSGLCDFKINRKPHILIAGQHTTSLQWEGQQPQLDWLTSIVNTVRSYSDRPIVFRPHPREPFRDQIDNIQVIRPRRINQFFDYDIDYNAYCVINHNSGPSVQSAINGTPVICHSSSLAWPVSSDIKDIEKITIPDRENWFVELCHTEWTLDEIKQGIPIKRLIPEIESQLS